MNAARWFLALTRTRYEPLPPGVYTDTLPETLVVLIERTEKCFVFRTKPLKGIAYHFSRNERFPV